jgi:methyl-accepting chemotaxis protein
MKSIKMSLLVLIISVFAVSFLFVNVFGSFLISSFYQEQIEKNHRNLALSISLNVKSFIEKAYSITEQIAANSDIYGFVPEEQEAVLKDTIKRHPYFDLFFIQDVEGQQSARSSGNLGNRANRWWFIQIMNDKKPFVSKSYYSLTGNIPVTSAILPIYDEIGVLQGIMGSDIKLDSLQTIVENFSDETTAFIIDGEGVVIAHPDKRHVSELYNYQKMEKTVLVYDDNDKVLIDESGNQVTEQKPIEISESEREIIQKVMAGETGFARVKTLDGDSRYAYYTPIELPGISDKLECYYLSKYK